MIKLMVGKHCHDCPQFDPMSDAIWENDKPTHYIRCSNWDICKEIRRYLMTLDKQKVEEATNDGRGDPNTVGDI